MEDKYEIKNFMYLNTKILEDYISVIDGFTYDEESQEIQNVNEKTLGGSAGVKIISGNGEIATKKVDEVNDQFILVMQLNLIKYLNICNRVMRMNR